MIEPAPTRDHTELMLRAAGVTRDVAAAVGQHRPARAAAASARSTCPATSRRRRRSSSPRRSSPSRGSRSTTSTSTRAAPGLLDVLERMGGARRHPRAPQDRRGAGRRHRGALGRADRDDDHVATRCRCSSTSCRSSALLAACARGESWVYGAGELRHKETDRIEALVDALRAIGVRAKGARRRLLRHRRARRGRAAARSTPAATTGSRCSAPLQGLRRREGVEVRGAESVGSILPRLLRPPRSRLTRR